MESRIKVRASDDEMRSFFLRDGGVRYYEALPGGGIFSVIYRHAEGHKMTGIYTVAEVEAKREAWRKETAEHGIID